MANIEAANEETAKEEAVKDEAINEKTLKDETINEESVKGKDIEGKLGFKTDKASGQQVLPAGGSISRVKTKKSSGVKSSGSNRNLKEKQAQKTSRSDRKAGIRPEGKRAAKKDEAKQKIFNLKKNDYIILSVLVIFFVAVNIFFLSDSKQLPSPIYGGDYYHQLGCMNHIRYGGNPLDNCNLISDNPVYLPLFSTLQAYFANAFGLESIQAIFIFSYISIALSVLVLFLLFRALFLDPLFAAFGVFLMIPVFPIMKYTNFGYKVMAPLLILMLFIFYARPGYKNAIFLGLAAGFSSITHSTLLPVSYGFIGALFIFLLMGKRLEMSKPEIIFKRIKKFLPFFLVMAAVALPVTMLYWYEPIFISHLQTSQNYVDWNGPGDLTDFSLQLHLFGNTIKNLFLRFSGIIAAAATSFFIFGLLLMFTVKKMDERFRFIIFALVTSAALTYHYFLTVPLLGLHFIPNYVYGMTLAIVKILVSVFGLYCIFKLFKPLQKYREHIIIGLLIVFAVSFVAEAADVKENHAWMPVSKQELNPMQKDLISYVTQETDVNDVFLTTKETGFMLNSLTGRKLVSSRRAHNDPFENLDPREASMAIILYGNDTEAKKELIERYNIKYLYWDYYWIQSEYYINDKGQVTGWFDPLIFFKNQSLIDELEKNGVSYFIEDTYVDPSMKDKWHPTYELVFISPKNYHNASHPWHPNLDQYLQEVWSYSNDGRKIARIFKIDIS